MSLNQAAFVFPGQGSQYVGMGKDLFETHSIVRATFRVADEILFEVSQLCFDGPEEELNQTNNTQVCIFTLNCAIFFLLVENGFIPQIVAGHSLGEYSALVAAKVISFEEGLKLIRKRAELMDKAAKSSSGKMLAVLGLEAEKVREIVESLKNKGIIEVANYNCPGQTVISGDKEAVDQAKGVFENAGAKKVVGLKVSGGFHSPLMTEAEEKFEKFLKRFRFEKAAIPVVSNVTAQATNQPDLLKKALSRQITGSVRWEQSIYEMLKNGAATFIEVGPGKVLSGLIKRTAGNHSVFNVENLDTFNKFLKVFG